MKAFKSIKEIAQDAAMMLVGLAFALHMAKVLLARYNLTLYDLWTTLLKMPGDLWRSGESLFCALGLLVTGLGLALAGWAFLQEFLSGQGVTLRGCLSGLKKPFKVKKTV